MIRSKAVALSLVGALALGTAALALGGEDEPKKAAVGKKAPTFELVDSKGQKRDIADYKERIIVLEWLNPRCPWVEGCYRKEVMQDAYKQVKEMSPDLVWLAINTTHNTTPEENNGWIKRFELEYPVLMDTAGKVGRMYKARRTPHMFVIDKEGILRYHGAIDNNQFGDKSESEYMNFVVNAVKQITSEETVAPDYVEPYGCTVKFKKR